MDAEGALQTPRQMHSMPAVSTQPIDTLELNAGHALGFVVMASSGLLILFFFKVRETLKSILLSREYAAYSTYLFSRSIDLQCGKGALCHRMQ
jgi:hypothetical protein